VPSTRAILKVLLVAAATAAAFYLLFLVRSILYMVFIAVFLAVALGPAVDVYQRRARMPRSLAILFVYLTILAAIIVNIWAFHLLMAPEGLPPAVVVTIFELFLVWSYRDRFAGILRP